MPRVSFWDRRGGGRGDPRGRSRSRRLHALGFTALVGLLVSACAPTLQLDPPVGPPRPRFEVGRDTFAFPNVVRAEHPDREDVFANYCVIMARTASQFFRFARFAPERPAVARDEYTRLTQAVIATGPWTGERPDEQRVVIPGYANLYDLSRAQEAAVKAAFGSAVLSIMHWRTWRVMFALSPAHQEGVARELTQEVDARRPASLMITNLPNPDQLNHAVLVYDYRRHAGVVEFLAYDPNDPERSLSLYYAPATRGFWVASLTYSPPGRIRAFRLFTSPLL